MKVLHVIHRFVNVARRGSELYTYELCRALAGRHEVAVVCTSPENAAGRVERRHVDGVPTFVVGSADSWEEAKLRGQSRQAERTFGRVLHEWRPDVVHFQHLLFHSLWLPTIAARVGVPSLFIPGDSDEPSLFLSAADACVLPFDDGVSLNNSTVAGAAVHRLPIISRRGAFVESAFRHEDNIVLCPPRDPAALARAIETLMDRPDLRKALVSGATQMTEQWFSWDHTAARILSLLAPGR
jgi:glycosyltransferase involved in cell wall biosynthesis